MRTLLFGVETEYAVSGFGARGERLDGDWLGAELVRAARAKVPSLPSASSGVFLASGHRIYVDAGEHLEICTPECTTPEEVVRYTLAGDRLLATLVDELVARRGEVRELVVTRCNVDYSGAGTTWASHESYRHRIHPEVLARDVVPHFVSRIVYRGAGGFDVGSSGAAFMVSPRVAHLVAERSASSTGDRGIYHRKDEGLAKDGSRRLHVLCGESVCSRLAAWLRLGVTALIVGLIDAEVPVGRGVWLRDPLDAMRVFARDPTCRAEAATEEGRMLSALAIQRHYLERVEAHVGDGRLPAWADAVCRVWRATLDAISDGPDAVATKLDWAIKLALFRRHAERRGFAWEAVVQWSAIARGLADALVASGHRGSTLAAEEAIGVVKGAAPAAFARLDAALVAYGLRWNDVRAFMNLKHELCEIDTRFGELGPRGVFGTLERAGVLDDDAPGVGDVARALVEPPAVGRARLRGEAIRTLARGRQGAIADWQGVWDKRRRRMLDLGDPLADSAEWQPWEDDTEIELIAFLRRR